MLANLSAEVRACRGLRKTGRDRTKYSNPARFIEMERHWLKLARSYQLFERVQIFSAHQEQQRGELSDRSWSSSSVSWP
jgi:hypothetical protein